MRLTEERFVALWQRSLLSGKQTDPQSLYRDLMQRYSESHRYYHTWGHIDHCLGLFDLAYGQMDDPDAVEMALWFHDSIYDLHAKDNERKSADLFTGYAIGVLEPAFVQKVCKLILITQHLAPPSSLDEQYIVDIDLSSFGLPEKEFKQDSEAVRQEYAHIPDESYYSGRTRFMQSLADRSTVYHTDFFRTRYESTAQQNLQRALTTMHEQGYLS